MPRKKGVLTAARHERVTEVVGPLMVQGMGCRKISARTGIPRATVAEDMILARQLWNENHSNSRDEWNGRLLAQYDWMLGELAEAWQNSKDGRITRIINPDGSELVRQEPPDPRWLSGMLSVAKEASTFLGIREGVDAISRVEVPEATKAALQPMTADAYQAMLMASGGLSQLNAVPPVGQRHDEIETVDVRLDQQGETDPDPDGSQLPDVEVA